VLLSNASADYLLPIMQRLGLNTLFERAFVSSEIGFAKPDPKIYEHVLHATSTLASDAVMIDDNSINTDSAVKLGIHGIEYGSVVQCMHELREII
jgi:HAD superfamily hydrolase (TIGR01509 family)